MKVSKLFYSAYCAALVLAVSVAEAQNIEALDVDLQDQEVEQTNVRLRAKKQVVEVEEDKMAPPSGGVWIMNTTQQGGASAAQAQASQVQAQPTTYVEASPLATSRADELRKARQGAEIQTEQKIVEKLEESRLNDERRRANRLFGDRWDNMNEQPAPPVQPAPQPQVVQVVPVQAEAEAKVVEEDDSDEKLEAAKAEILSEIRSQRTLQDEVKEEIKESPKYYIGGALGVAEYNDVSNMQGNGAAGFSVGTLMPNGVVVEGSFMYSNYYIDEFWKINYFKELDQYNFNMAVKYSPLQGMFRPLVGATAGYTYRSYTDRTQDTYFNNVPNDEEVSTNAVDIGLLVGVDLAVSDNFIVGTEYRYSRNIVNRSESDFINRADLRRPEYTTPIEELDYYMLTVNGKFTF